MKRKPNMTPDEINNIIAVAMNLDVSHLPDTPRWRTCYFTKEAAALRRSRWPRSAVVKCVPNYCEDLNEIHKVKLTLSQDKLGTMLDALCAIVTRDKQAWCGPMTAITQAFRATPLQEAEALLCVLV